MAGLTFSGCSFDENVIISAAEAGCCSITTTRSRASTRADLRPRDVLLKTRSTNGTMSATKKSRRVQIEPGQLFRIGRTWLRIEPATSFVPLDADDLPF